MSIFLKGVRFEKFFKNFILFVIHLHTNRIRGVTLSISERSLQTRVIIGQE